jgi:hypothetical protein
MIIQIIIILFIIISCKYNYDMLQFNQFTNIIQIYKPNKVHIQTELKHKNPMIIHNLLSTFDKIKGITIESLISSMPGYIIQDNQKLISLETFLNVNTMFIHNNQKMIQDCKLDKSIHECSQYFMDAKSCNRTHSLSIYKGYHSIEPIKNKHNITLLHQIHNQSTIYLINPKHNEDILEKTNQEIKKWSYKLTLEQGQILVIPPEWTYFYETQNISILITTTADNYFTFLFNTLR